MDIEKKRGERARERELQKKKEEKRSEIASRECEIYSIPPFFVKQKYLTENI